MKYPKWLKDEVDKILFKEAYGSGFEEALSLLSPSARALVEEVITRKGRPNIGQGRRGSPASDINALYPVVLYLITNGLSASEAWKLLRDRIPQRSFRNAQRQLNRARSEGEKVVHIAASSIIDGNSNRFRTAYRKLQRLLE